MSRYKCPYCEEEFDEFDTRTEHEEFWGAPCSIEYYICPCCREDVDPEECEYDEEDYEEDEE